MQLSEFPEKIYQAAIAVAALDEQISKLRQRQEKMEVEIELAIAFDSDLKNEQQRKTKRAELLLEYSEYQAAVEAIVLLNQSRTEAVAKLELRRNEFSVAKLEARAAIVQQLAGLEVREMVGM